MLNKFKFVVIIVIEQYRQSKAARREARIARQQRYVEELAVAMDNHPFDDYVDRYRCEAAKLNRIQRI